MNTSPRLSEALSHIERNGNLVWMPSLSVLAAQELFEEMKRRSLIERNAWSGKWQLVHTESHNEHS